MNATELERLLWEQIDGRILADDADRLRRLLATEAGAKRLWTEIADLAKQLGDLEEVPIPDGLDDQIRRAVRAAGEAPAHITKSASARPHAFFRRVTGPRPLRRLAYLAAGLVLAVVGYQLLVQETDRDAGPFVGTAGLAELGSEAPAVRLELPDSGGVLEIFRDGRGLRLELVVAPSLAAARLEILGTGLAVGHRETRGAATVELRTTGSGIELDVVGSGTIELTLIAGPESRQATVTVRTGDDVLASHQLSFEPNSTD